VLCTVKNFYKIKMMCILPKSIRPHFFLGWANFIFSLTSASNYATDQQLIQHCFLHLNFLIIRFCLPRCSLPHLKLFNFLPLISLFFFKLEGLFLSLSFDSTAKRSSDQFVWVFVQLNLLFIIYYCSYKVNI